MTKSEWRKKERHIGDVMYVNRVDRSDRRKAVIIDTHKDAAVMKVLTTKNLDVPRWSVGYYPCETIFSTKWGNN